MGKTNLASSRRLDFAAVLLVSEWHSYRVFSSADYVGFTWRFFVFNTCSVVWVEMPDAGAVDQQYMSLADRTYSQRVMRAHFSSISNLTVVITCDHGPQARQNDVQDRLMYDGSVFFACACITSCRSPRHIKAPARQRSGNSARRPLRT